VGESQEERDAGETESVVSGQLDALLGGIAPTMLAKLVVAYEPVWAIGAGKAARPGDVQAIHQMLRSELRRADDSLGRHCLLLYGGSVKKESARELFELPDVDGGLIGGASLLAPDFLAIVDAASSACVAVR
jgi:triosephosphate isomerase